MLEVDEGALVLSPSGLPFEVVYRAKHGQDCSRPMVVYRNLTDTGDTKAGTVWVMDEALFLKLFRSTKQ